MTRRHRVRRGVVTVVAAGLVAWLVAVPAGAEPRAGLAWGACPEDVATGGLALECTTVPVPLDYRDQDGRTIDLTVSRLASTDPAKRRGVLLLNPGGPGGSGLSLPADLASRGIPASVLDAYDLIGMDTRGVGHSTPVSCGFTADQDYLGNIPPYAVDDAAVTRQAAIARDVAEQCAAHDDDDVLRHLSTANNARDLDRIRAALGEEKASFLGYSYGTALGAAYASMFAGTTDRVVLDSNLGDTFLDHDGMRRFGLGAEETFPDFARWAAKRHASYGLGRTPAEVERTYFRLAGQLDEAPMNGIDGRLFRLVLFAGLYSEVKYGLTAQIWQSVARDDAAAAHRLTGELLAEGTPAAGDNAWTVFLAVTCNDVDWSADLGTYRQAVAQDRERYPKYGAAAANVTPCAYWPYEPAEPPVAIDDDGRENVLLLQNLRDPATPLRGAELLDEKFGPRSRLVTVDGSGHGVYVFGGNPCALNVATGYLVDGDLPANDVSCRAGRR